MNITLNAHFDDLEKSYLFSEIGRRVARFTEEHPGERVIRLGIGDVTLPLAPVVIEAMESAVTEMGARETFHGYPPEFGYDFLREAIARRYEKFGVAVEPCEVYVSDGAKSDAGNITELFGEVTTLIPDPVYPVYLDSNRMSGHRVRFLPASEENGFLPTPDGLPSDPFVIYLCSPNNPTGAVYDREGLFAWVDFALRTGSLLLYDAAYEAYIPEGQPYPHSIFEIEGARDCAIEICSFSKFAGFTGTRCSWTVIPKNLASEGVPLHELWERRQATKFNGVPYIVQRGAEAALSPQGEAQCAELVSYYMENARAIASLLREKGVFFTGGVCSPYIWLRCPGGVGSWEFFDRLLAGARVVGTPGAGFGTCGEGYFRLTSFGTQEDTAEAVGRLRDFLT